MARTALPTLFVVILLVLSGCNALDFGTQNNRVSVTPAPVPTDEPGSRSTPQRISCLSSPSIKNTSGFIYNSTAPDWDNTSFTVREVRTEIFQNGSLHSHTSFTGRIAENLSRIHFSETEIGSSANLSQIQDYLRVNTIPTHRLPSNQPVYREIWTNSTQVVSRTTSGHTAHYYAGPPPYDFGHIKGALAPVRIILYGEIQVQNVSKACVINRLIRNGTTLYRITFSTATPPDASDNATDRGNITGSALIDSRGIIHELRYDYTIRTADGAVVTVTESIYITNIGSTTADRPEWYGMAMNRTQSQNRTQTDRFEWLGDSNRVGEGSDAFDFDFDQIAVV